MTDWLTDWLIHACMHFVHYSHVPFRFFFSLNGYFLVYFCYKVWFATFEWWIIFWLWKSGFLVYWCVRWRGQYCNFCAVMEQLQMNNIHTILWHCWCGWNQWCRSIYPKEITVAPLFWLQQLLLCHASKGGERYIVDLWRKHQRESSWLWWFMRQ